MSVKEITAKAVGKGWRLSGDEKLIAEIRKHLDEKYMMQTTKPDVKGCVVAVCGLKRRREIEAAATSAGIIIEDLDTQHPISMESPPKEPKTTVQETKTDDPPLEKHETEEITTTTKEKTAKRAAKLFRKQQRQLKREAKKLKKKKEKEESTGDAK